jgi:GT2 family glycosyltransferase
MAGTLTLMADPDPTPRVTVSLVTFQGERWLPGCIASLDRQDFADVEIIVHDNASRDGTRALLGEWTAREPRLRIHESATNRGFAAGHNASIRAARGEFIVLVNQDTELDEGFLSAIVAAFEAHPEAGSVQPRVRQLAAPGDRLVTLDTTGLIMGRDRRAVSRGQDLPDGPDHQRGEAVWGADGPLPAYRLAALREAALPRPEGSWEVLDEDFFLYKEDVDLAWRLRLLGWTAWYEPSALGWHGRGSGGTGATTMLDIARTNRSVGSQVRRLSWRNQRLMQLKNEDLAGYLRDLPWIWAREVLSLLFILVNDPRDLAAVVSLFRLAPRAWRKRRLIRSRIRDLGRERPPAR